MITDPIRHTPKSAHVEAALQMADHIVAAIENYPYGLHLTTIQANCNGWIVFVEAQHEDGTEYSFKIDVSHLPPQEVEEDED